MPRRAVVLTLALCASAVPALAKFGVSKTKVVLPRQRPPEIPMYGETVALDVTSRSRAVTDRHLSTVRGELEAALTQGGTFRLAERPEDAANVVRVTLDELQARIRESVVMENRYVKIGERQEWDDKKKKMVTKDVHGNREEPVPVRVVSGYMVANLEVETPPGTPRRIGVGEKYDQEFKGTNAPPAEASSETALEDWLVEQTARHAVAAVAFSADPVEVLLAVDGELKAGNRLAETGRFQDALAEWSRRMFKGDKEAARLHNVGVAHEALAYAVPLHDAEHREHLREAERHYKQATQLDPGEKYFREPLERITVSIGYAEAATKMMAEREASSRGPASGGASGGSAAAPTLRNGSFESSLTPWRLDGGGAVVREAQRGRVLELVAGGGSASVAQDLDLPYGDIAPAAIRLDYRVVKGEPPIKMVLRYEDAGGRMRTSVVDVSAGESPAGWSSWEMELDRLRPSPMRLKEVTLQVQDGTVRLDNVALTTR